MLNDEVIHALRAGAKRRKVFDENGLYLCVMPSCSCSPCPSRRQVMPNRGERNAPREVYFEAVRAEIARYYLADPSSLYQHSGRSSGEERWRETRHCIVQAVHRDGDLLDVGCASGLLLESLIGWAADHGVSIRPMVSITYRS